jgi:hypothetical protein
MTRCVRPNVEVLEDRLAPAVQMLYDPAAGQLTLIGDAADNTARVSLVAGRVEVDLDGQAGSFAAAGLHAINFNSAGEAGGANSRSDILTLAGQGSFGSLAISTDGLLIIDNGAVLSAAAFSASAGVILNGGSISGGTIAFRAGNFSNQGTLAASQSVTVHFTGSYIDTAAAVTEAPNIAIDGGATSHLFASGTFLASRGALAPGGSIDLLGREILLVAATVNASGDAGGGSIRIGGDYQGSNPAVANAASTFINPFTTIRADALASGNGGRVIVWSDVKTEFYGTISAQGGPAADNGGFIEVSGKEDLTFAGPANAGRAGTLLLDPKNLTISTSGVLPSFDFQDPNPDPSGDFGKFVVPLSTGNVVIVDDQDSLTATNAGAVYLFNGANGALISQLTGSTAGDQVGSGGVTALTNGNYVVRSFLWNNGAATNAGAVTFGNGTTGISGVVSAANSLVGSTSNDAVGSFGVTALANGNYVVNSPGWNNGAATSTGAVTFGNGTTGISGAVSAANSLVGSTSYDQVGLSGVTALANGNYVVSSQDWNNGTASFAGAVTFGSGTSGITGVVSAANSLVGSSANDWVGSGYVIALANSNYVVVSSNWHGPAFRVGAVTFGSGTTGISGTISSANSLVGSTANDQIGSGGVTRLANGNYVVVSPAWQGGGAVTFGNGTTGISGTVSAANSLTGSSASYGVVALTNGNYVVVSPGWDGVGAVTFGNGTTGISGTVSATNSLVGTTANDQIGVNGVTALPNGNYVVSSASWNNGTASYAGAVTFGNGTTGISGPVSAANSLVGSSTVDGVGSGGITVLANGNYVVSSRYWNGAAAKVGAVTFGSGTTGVSGVVSAANSLVGSTFNDQVGFGVTALANGNYVIRSPLWDGAAADVGAVTFGNGTTGINGAVSAANSLVGSTLDDGVGSGGITVLANGNYVVSSLGWNNGAATLAGAVTFGDGTTGISGVVSAANSLVGSTMNDQVGYKGVTPLANGNYVVSSWFWNNGSATSAGAVTFGNGTTGISGVVSAANSLVGSTSGDDVGTGSVTALANGNYVVSSPKWASGAAANAGALTLVSGTTGQTLTGFGPINAQNSLIGRTANTGLGNVVLDAVNHTFLANFTTENGGRVTAAPDDVSLGSCTFGFFPGSNLGLQANVLINTLMQGSNVVLQANNDITIDADLIVNPPSGNGGNLTLQAGRSIILNGRIVTGNGNLTLIANELLANGVIDAQRDPGAAVITMGAGVSIDAGTGSVDIELRSGAGLTNNTTGAITLGPISAGSLTVTNNGPTAGSGIIVNGSLTVAGPGGMVDLNAAGVTENGGSIVAENLRLQGTGSFMLTDLSNTIQVLAAAVNGSIKLFDNTDLTVGSVGGTNGIATQGGDVILNTPDTHTMTVTQTIDTTPGSGGLVVTGTNVTPQQPNALYQAGAGNIYLNGPFSDNFVRPDAPTLGPDWQAPPLPEKYRFTYHRRLGVGSFALQNNAAHSVGTSIDAEQVVGKLLLNSVLSANVDASNAGALVVGLLARIQSNGDAYGAILTNGNMAEIILFHASSNSFDVLGTPMAAGSNAGNLTFTVNGNNLSLVCGTASFSVIDNTLTAPGTVGIFAQGPNGIIGNFSVTGS